MEALEPGDPRSAGRCRIAARLGGGGMGTVYFGFSGSGRPAAIKVMHAEFAADREFRDRFRREIAATGAVRGGYGLSVLDADPDAERPWLATAFLPSVSLRTAVGRFGAQPADTVWRIAAGLADTLAAVHGAGLVHLDLSPSNVLLTAGGPRVIDYGIARRLGRDGAAHLDVPAGAPPFMPPEQEAGGPVGPAGDVFAFGATLGYACTGAPPFGDERAWLGRITDDVLRALVADCMHPDPARRPTVPDLIRYLAARARQHPLSGTWPADVADAIRVAEAEPRNLPVPVPPSPPGAPTPPLPPGAPGGSGEVEAAGPPAGAPAPRDRTRRRALLCGLAGAAGLLVVGGAGPTVARSWSASGTAAPPTPAPTATPGVPSPSRSGAGRTLEFEFTGHATLTSIAYTVNGQSAAGERVSLPWRRTFTVPAAPARVPWKYSFSYPGGNVTCQVLVDGYQIAVGTYVSNTTFGGHDSGTL
jgi:protein kinase-like protein